MLTIGNEQRLSRILLLEDDSSLVDGLCYSLKKSGYEVETAGCVREAKEFLARRQYDLLLLDVTLPDGTGFQVCEAVRAQGDQVPIIFLTASDEEINVIRGLDSGGDDYVGKPFKLGELLSRIRALLRRAGVKQAEEKSGGEESLVCGEIRIDFAGNRVFYAKLTPGGKSGKL